MDSLFIGKNILRFDTLESTNSYAIELLKNERLTEGTLIIASHQTKGRGQRGNDWDSESGKNLTFSLVINPTFLDFSKQFYLSKITALAIYDCLTYVLSSSQYDVNIKWPNDILLNNRKIAGILIESQFYRQKIHHSVVGIGINVNQTTFSDKLPVATSIRNEIQEKLDLNFILNSFCSFFESWYLKLRAGKFDLISKEYLQRLFFFQSEVKFLKNDLEYKGKILDVNEDGKLCVESDEGVILYYEMKEIKILY